MSPRAAALLVLFTLLAACGGSDSTPAPTPTPTPSPQQDALMSPGSDCLTCHGAGGSATHKYTAAGTVYADASGSAAASGAQVVITGSSASVTLTTNSAGNFYTTTQLGTLHAVTVNGVSMVSVGATTTGACNGCHYVGGPAGRIHP